ncbi:MAG TPA: CYTH domain-containing protein [Chloroflexota bacterium]
MSQPLERELKLVPSDAGLLDQLAHVDHLGPFVAARHWRERQCNSFFDTPRRALASARVGFRRRQVEGERLAIWTLKGDTAAVRGIATREEIELSLRPDLAPGVALGTLAEAARSRGASALARAVGDALGSDEEPTPPPLLETETDRTLVDLEAVDLGWRVELALDRVRLIGHVYTEVEIEAELKRGEPDALQEVRRAIAELGAVRESNGSKLSRALEHLRTCDCAASG